MKHYLSGNAPVSFLDVAQIIEEAQNIQELPDGFITALIALHDAPHTTLGGKEVLTHFLNVQAEKRKQERTLATRIIGFADQGQRARISNGETLEVTLPQRRAQGIQWRFTQKPASAQISAHEEDGKIIFKIRLTKTELTELIWQEDGPAHIAADELKQFSLQVVVEEKS